MYYIMLKIMTSLIQKKRLCIDIYFLKLRKKVKVAYESLHWKKNTYASSDQIQIVFDW